MTIQVQAWNTTLVVDDDGHLFVGIRNADGSTVERCHCDVAGSQDEWADRFTTTNIERNYTP